MSQTFTPINLASLSAHFDKTNENGYTVLRLKATELTNFLTGLPSEFRTCYISDEELESRMRTFNQTREEVLLEVVPDNSGLNVRTGEFGELLTFYLTQELEGNSPYFAVQKWRWKEGKNRICHESDVVILRKVADTQADPNDEAICCESKLQSSAIFPSRDPVKNALEDTQKDANDGSDIKISRLASSLNWIRERYRKDLNKNASDYLDRFIDSIKPEHGEYQKKFKAVVITDKSHEARAIEPRTIPALPYPFEVVIILIDELNKNVAVVYDNIPKS